MVRVLRNGKYIQ